jgi:hypothetical protein
VCCSTPRRQQFGHGGLVDAHRRGFDVRERLRRQFESIEHHDADAIRPVAQVEAELESKEGDRAFGAYCVAENLAAVRVQAAGNVE